MRNTTFVPYSGYRESQKDISLFLNDSFLNIESLALTILGFLPYLNFHGFENVNGCSKTLVIMFRQSEVLWYRFDLPHVFSQVNEILKLQEP